MVKKVVNILGENTCVCVWPTILAFLYICLLAALGQGSAESSGSERAVFCCFCFFFSRASPLAFLLFFFAIILSDLCRFSPTRVRGHRGRRRRRFHFQTRAELRFFSYPHWGSQPSSFASSL